MFFEMDGSEWIKHNKKDFGVEDRVSKNGSIKGSDAMSKSYTSSSKKRDRRSVLACVRCRKRHVKCPGGQPCSRCEKGAVSCEYKEPLKKLVVSMQYLQQLQDNLIGLKRENERLKSIIEPLQKDLSRYDSKTDPSVNSQEPVTNEVDEIAEDDQEQISTNFIQRCGRLVESRAGVKQFVGSSSMTLFGLEIQSLVSKYLSKDKVDPLPIDSKTEFDIHGSCHTEFKENGLNSVNNLLIKNPVLKIEHQEDKECCFRMRLATKKNLPDIELDVKLPSYSYAILLVDAFVKYNDGCYYFFNEGLVKHELACIYNSGSLWDDDYLQTIWFCKILLIFAIGEMYTGAVDFDACKNMNDDVPGTNNSSEKNSYVIPGSQFFKKASELFYFLFAGERLEGVTKKGGIETLLLYGFYLQVADCTMVSYFYCGQALRACLVLGMHVDAEKDSLTRFELEHHRRLWWTVYMFERMLSSKAGLPLNFSDNTITTALPENFDMQSPPRGCEHYIFPIAESITSCVKIVQINANILDKLYKTQPQTNILPILKDIIKSLLDWRNSLSEFIQVDFAHDKLEISRLETNVFTEYFQGINLAIRPLLFHFVTLYLKQLKNSNTYINLQNYSSVFSTLLNYSLQASVNTIRALWSMREKRMIALFGYMDREYLFTSSCTLLLFNAAFGIHEQTYAQLDHALEIFTIMKSLGNDPAGLRRAQLLTLMANLDFHGIMKDMIMKYSDIMKYDTSITQSEKAPPLEKPLGTPESSEKFSLFDFINSSLVQSYQAPLTKKGSEIMEQNVTQLDPLNSVDDFELQEVLEEMVEEDYIDDKLWKEISDQAMWLGNAMDPGAPKGSEIDFGECLI